MIRWARKSDIDEQCNWTSSIHDRTYDFKLLRVWETIWAAQWTRRKQTNDTPVKTTRLKEDITLLSLQTNANELEANLSQLAGKHEAGQRLIVIFRYLIDMGLTAQQDFYESVVAAKLMVEQPHLSDPLPGDPRINMNWMKEKGILTSHCSRSNSTQTAIGMVLRRPFTESEIVCQTFKVEQTLQNKTDYFPHPRDRMNLIPNSLIRANNVDFYDIQQAYKIDMAGAVCLINELLFANILTIV